MFSFIGRVANTKSNNAASDIAGIQRVLDEKAIVTEEYERHTNPLKDIYNNSANAIEIRAQAKLLRAKIFLYLYSQNTWQFYLNQAMRLCSELPTMFVSAKCGTANAIKILTEAKSLFKTHNNLTGYEYKPLKLGNGQQMLRDILENFQLNDFLKVGCLSKEFIARNKSSEKEHRHWVRYLSAVVCFQRGDHFALDAFLKFIQHYEANYIQFSYGKMLRKNACAYIVALRQSAEFESLTTSHKTVISSVSKRNEDITVWHLNFDAALEAALSFMTTNHQWHPGLTVTNVASVDAAAVAQKIMNDFRRTMDQSVLNQYPSARIASSSSLSSFSSSSGLGSPGSQYKKPPRMDRKMLNDEVNELLNNNL